MPTSLPGTPRSGYSDSIFAMDDLLQATPAATSRSLSASLDAWTRDVLASQSSDAAADLLKENLGLASQRIEACAREHGQHLDLSKLGLPSLPSAIGTLTDLRTLDLSGNRLSTLPPELDDLRWLRELDLSHNEIRDTQPELPLNSLIARVDLSHNPLQDFPEGLIGHIRRGTRVVCHSTPIPIERQVGLEQALGAHFTDDLFQPGWMAISASAKKSSLTRNDSATWNPAQNRPRVPL